MQTLTQQQEDKLKVFINLFIDLPETIRIMADFDRLRFNKRLEGELQCMLVTGDTGSGKSYLIKEYKQKLQKDDDRFSMTVLVSRIPSKPRLCPLIMKMLKSYKNRSFIEVFFSNFERKTNKNAIFGSVIFTKNN